MMRRKGFTLVELMVVVAIIAILAAVAVPMYTKFQQKARVGTCIKATMGTFQAFQDWYSSEESFSSLVMAADADGSGNQTFTGTTVDGVAAGVGVNLPFADGVTWTPTFTATKVTIAWGFGGNRCPAVDCDGQFCVWCSDTGCQLEIVMNPGSAFTTLNKNPGTMNACSK